MPEHTIAENLTRLQNAKTAIGNAIAAKGGTVASGDGLEEFAADIATIPTGENISAPKRKTMLNKKYSSNWSTMTWTGLTSFDGAYIWTDGTVNDVITRHYFGYGKSKSPSELLEQYRRTFLNIDMMIIKELEELFMMIF